MSTRQEREAVAEAAEDRIYWATWEENHYASDGIRKLVVTARAEEAENWRKGGRQ